MGDTYVGEIRLAGFNYVPQGWLPCDGSLQSISDYSALFTLIGTTYGGDGVSQFAMPDLRGRVPVHQGTGSGQSIALGLQLGSETVTLNGQQLGAHNHNVVTGPASVSSTPGSAFLLGDVGGGSGGGSGGVGTAPPPPYGGASGLTALATRSIGPAGNSQPHENRQPLLAVNYIISPFGVFPSQT